jgi:4-hydroxy-tetrahydrodipicolinate synthase
MSIFKGAGVAIVTPFHENLEVNYDKLGELIDDQIAHKTDAIIICGTTGESATLSMEEHKQVIKYCVDHTAGRVPVIAGTGSNDTAAALELSVQAEKDGADALLIVTPYYNKATQKGLIEHYKLISDSVNIPIVMYNVPSRTGCNILPETAVAIARSCRNVVAIKDATGNLSQTTRMAMLAQSDGCLDIYSGEDGLVVPIMSVGGIGVISVLSNVAPEETHDMTMACLEGDYKKACELQLKYTPLVDSLFCEVNPIPVKTAMNLMGMEVGPFRRPMCEMEPKNIERLKGDLKAVGLL